MKAKTLFFTLITILLLSITSCGDITGSNNNDNSKTNQQSGQTDNSSQEQQEQNDDDKNQSEENGQNQENPVDQNNEDDDIQNPQQDDDENKEDDENGGGTDVDIKDEDEEDDDDNNQPKILTITLGDEYDISSLNNYEKVILAVPQDATSIDALALAFIHMEIKNYYQWQEPDFELEFADYPENAQNLVVDYDAIIQTHNTKYENETPWENNTDVLKDFYQTFNYEKLNEKAVGETVETEIIPGLRVLSFLERRRNGRAYSVQHALKFTDDSHEKEVNMPAHYSLTGTYNGGIIGNNVTLENLSADTHVSGEVLGMWNFSSIYDLFVKDISGANLPYMQNVTFERSNTIDLADGVTYDADNLYGYNIDKIIEKYYTNNKGSKLSLDLPSETKFDARAYLNGSKMYSGNNYQDNAYPLDINAALIMANARVNNINNVNLIGEKNTELNSLEYLTNVRVSANMSGISITRVSGVVEFMDEAPSKVYGTGFTVFKKVSNDMIIKGLGYVDATALNQSAANHFKPESTDYTVKQFAVQGSVTFPNSSTSLTPAYVNSVGNLNVTKEQVEKNTIEGNLIETPISKTLPNNAKPASKVDLMRNILEDNQKQYS